MGTRLDKGPDSSECGLFDSRIVRRKPLTQDAHERERRFRSLAQDGFERRLMDLEHPDVGLRTKRCDARAARDDGHLSDHVADTTNCERSAASNDIDLSVHNHVRRIAGLPLSGNKIPVRKQVLLGHLCDRLQVLWWESGEERRFAEDRSSMIASPRPCSGND